MYFLKITESEDEAKIWRKHSGWSERRYVKNSANIWNHGQMSTSTPSGSPENQEALSI